jgi:hypothetical protein
MSRNIYYYTDAYKPPIPDFVREFVTMFKKEYKTIGLMEFQKKCNKIYKKYHTADIVFDFTMLELIWSVMPITHFKPEFRTYMNMKQKCDAEDSTLTMKVWYDFLLKELKK